MPSKTIATTYTQIVTIFSRWLYTNESHLKTLSSQESVKAIRKKWNGLTWSYVRYNLAKYELLNRKLDSITYPESEE